eukprot:g12279.t1
MSLAKCEVPTKDQEGEGGDSHVYDYYHVNYDDSNRLKSKGHCFRKVKSKSYCLGKAPPQLAADSGDDDDPDDSKSGGLQPAHSSTSRSTTLMPLVATWIDILLPPATRLQANIQIRAFLTEAIPHGHPAALTIARAGNDPADKWAALSDRYGNKGQIATAKLLFDLFQGAITSSDDLPTFIDRTHARFEQLAARNIILPDMMKTIFTLHKLHASHHDYLKTVGATLYCTTRKASDPATNTRPLSSPTMQASRRMEATEVEGELTAGPNGGATKKCHNCSRTNHVAGDCRATCARKGCEGKPTHSGAECPLPRRSQKSTKSTTHATPPPKSGTQWSSNANLTVDGQHQESEGEKEAPTDQWDDDNSADVYMFDADSEKDESDEEQATPSTASFPDAPLQPTADSGGGML